MLASTKKEEGVSKRSTDWLKAGDSEVGPKISPPLLCTPGTVIERLGRGVGTEDEVDGQKKVSEKKKQNFEYAA